MKTQLKQVEEFHNAFGQVNGTEPQLLKEDAFELRHRLMEEENDEYLEACWNGDLVQVADALGDELYILLGTMLKHGLQDKIEEAKEWMNGKAELLPVEDNNYIADFVNWNAKSIYFYDTVGNIVEFIARFDLQNDTAEKFNSSHVISVSEMGIVTNDVTAFADKLKNEYKVFDFVKSVNSDSFSAMGNDNGLFIIAIENRNWYPTKVPSQKSPFEIKFINDNGETFIITDKTM